MNIIPEDLFINITKYISYNKGKYLHKILRLQCTNREIFKSSISNFMMTKYILNNMCINTDELYDIIDKSSFEINDMYHIINKIEHNLITNRNKYEINFTYKYKNNVNVFEIKNTIKCIKIILNMISIYTSRDFMINNPYIYLHTSMCNMMTDYMVTHVRKIHANIDNSKLMKYKMMIFDTSWFYTDIDIYDALILYLSPKISLN